VVEGGAQRTSGGRSGVSLDVGETNEQSGGCGRLHRAARERDRPEIAFACLPSHVDVLGAGRQTGDEMHAAGRHVESHPVAARFLQGIAHRLPPFSVELAHLADMTREMSFLEEGGDDRLNERRGRRVQEAQAALNRSVNASGTTR
jgi:hypothetical protein